MTAPRSVWAGLSCRRAVRPRVVLAQSCPSQGCPLAQDDLKATQDGPRRSQDEPKTSPRRPKTTPRQPNEFKIVQDSSRRPKRTARRPMTAPRSVWAGLSCRRAVRPRVALAQSCPSQGCPVAQDDIKTTQDCPRRSQNEPKTSPRWPKISQDQH